MSDHTTGTSPERLALSAELSAAVEFVEQMSTAQSKFFTWYMSQHLADVTWSLHGYCKPCDRLECYHSFGELLDEYLTANPTALRQEDPR